jgi:hypothetical protein
MKAKQVVKAAQGMSFLKLRQVVISVLTDGHDVTISQLIALMEVHEERRHVREWPKAGPRGLTSCVHAILEELVKSGTVDAYYDDSTPCIQRFKWKLAGSNQSRYVLKEHGVIDRDGKPLICIEREGMHASTQTHYQISLTERDALAAKICGWFNEEERITGGTAPTADATLNIKRPTQRETKAEQTDRKRWRENRKATNRRSSK